MINDNRVSKPSQDGVVFNEVAWVLPRPPSPQRPLPLPVPQTPIPPYLPPPPPSPPAVGVPQPPVAPPPSYFQPPQPPSPSAARPPQVQIPPPESFAPSSQAPIKDAEFESNQNELDKLERILESFEGKSPDNTDENNDLEKEMDSYSENTEENPNVGHVNYMAQPIDTQEPSFRTNALRLSQELDSLGQPRASPGKYNTRRPVKSYQKVQSPVTNGQYQTTGKYGQQKTHQQPSVYNPAPIYQTASMYPVTQRSNAYSGLSTASPPQPMPYQSLNQFNPQPMATQPSQQKWPVSYSNPLYRPVSNSYERAQRPVANFYPAPMEKTTALSTEQQAVPYDRATQHTLYNTMYPRTQNYVSYYKPQPNMGGLYPSSNIQYVTGSKKSVVRNWPAPKASQTVQNYYRSPYKAPQGRSRSYQAPNQWYYNYYAGQKKSQRPYQVENNSRYKTIQNDRNRYYNQGTATQIDASTFSNTLSRQNINPQSYYAFRLNPDTTQSNRISYKNSLRTLGAQLNQLEKEKKLDFQPEQLNYVMNVLGRGLNTLAQRQTQLQPNTARLVGRNTILHPVNGYNNIYTLHYPHNPSSKPYSPKYSYGSLKRKKKNIKIDKTNKFHKQKSKRHARKRPAKKRSKLSNKLRKKHHFHKTKS